MALDQIREDRIKKLNKIKDAGVDPYPATSHRSHSVADARKSEGQTASVAGRLRSLRPHGKIAFADIEDESGKMQLFFSLNDTGEEKMKFLANLDIGDFIQAEGEVFTTQAGELTIRVKNYQLLTKTLLPLPSDWYGLKDTEERLRKRYLDMILNPEVRELFKKKSIFWQTMRSYMIDHGFLEVENPALESVPGGADARPFITHHNALDIDLYLRISLELPLKRLLVGGFEKVFEIGRIFRNEGIDDEHLQDYTQIEFYWAYADYNQLMDFVQDLYQTVIQKLFGSLQTEWKGHTIDWSGNWPRKEYRDLLNESWSVDIDKMSVEDLYALAKEKNVPVEPNLGKGRLLDYIYKKTIRPNLIQPMFVLNHPVEVEPLAKRLPNDPTKVQRMQILVMGSELGKGFSELNDPLDQRERFEDQMKLREAGDDEAQMLDEDFVEALEYGMPPTAGFGISERFFSMLMDRPIRECVTFPTMKPAETAKKSTIKASKHEHEAINSSQQDFSKKFVVVLNPDLEKWQMLNAIGHVSAFLGNKIDANFDTGDYFVTQDGFNHPRNSQYPIIVLSGNPSELKNLMQKVSGTELPHIGFTKEMIETTVDKEIEDIYKNKTENAVEYLAVGLFGDKDKVSDLTKRFSVLK